MTRIIVLALGILAVLVGLSQLVLGGWWIRIIPDMLTTTGFRASGLVSLLIGLLLIFGAGSGALGLRFLMLVIGLFMAVVGATLLLYPGFWHSFMNAMFVLRARPFQLAEIAIGGAIRVMLGTAMIYAALTFRPRDILY